MKKTICLLILFVANHTMAQLKVEELTNDSLMKVFISQQTGRGTQNVQFVTVKDLKEKKQIADTSIIDSVQTVQYIFDDFNKDGKQDLVVSYVERIILGKYFYGFNITAFISNSSGKYEVKDLWQRYDHLVGRIVKKDTKSKFFILARHWIEFRKEILRFDTLHYFQDQFINKGNTCMKGFDNIQYYTTSNWVSSSYRYSYFTVYANRIIRREDFDIGNKKTYQCQLKKDVFDSLNNLICAVNLWELKDRYEMENVYDIGTSHLIINYKGTVKKIDDYGHWGNFGLGAFYNVLRRLSRESEWILVEQNGKDNKLKLNRMPGEN